MSKLVHDSVSRTLIRMAVPMLGGTFAINMYNLTNAWFVSRLGTEALAAISFTFPVIMFLMFLTKGLGSGAMTQVAFALGAQDHDKAATFTLHALLLSALFSVLMTIVGLATARALFTHLGASGEVLETTVGFMRIWYLGAAIMVLEIVAADIIMGTGNTKAISALLLGSTLVNFVLDIGLIFGRFGLPKLGVLGAAWATLFAQAAALGGAIYILGPKLKLLSLRNLHLDLLGSCWSKILKFAIPGALGMILSPISHAVLTRLVSKYGNAAVAASGVASRIELFAFMIPMTVGLSLIPFVAQNYGAGRLDRIREARRITILFAIGYGLFIGLLWAVFANAMAGLFSTDPAVVDVLRSFVYITCAGYGLLEVHRYAGFYLTGMHEPIQASILDILRVIVLLIPLSFLGAHYMGLKGVFFGRLATDLLAGAIGIVWSGWVLAKKTSATHP